MSDDSIIDACISKGLSVDRLQEVLDSKDNWGKMVHAAEYLTVLDAVLVAWRKYEGIVACHACNWRGHESQLHREHDALGYNLYCPSTYCGAQVGWESDD